MSFCGSESGALPTAVVGELSLLAIVFMCSRYSFITLLYFRLPLMLHLSCPSMHSFAVLVGLLLCSACYGQTFGNTSFDADYEGVSAACGATLNAQLSCDDVLAAIAWDADYLQQKQLDNLCSVSCSTSLETARSSIVSACTGSSDVIVDGGLAYPATFVLDHLINAYQTTCRKDA